MSDNLSAKHTASPAKELLCMGVKDIEIVRNLLSGIGLIEKLELDPKLNVPVVQLFSAKATEQAIKQRTFTISGSTITIRERPAAGFALGGDMAGIMRSREGVRVRCEQLLDYANAMRNSQTEKHILENVEKAIRGFGGVFANCTLKSYGSRRQGLQLKGISDLDLFAGEPGRFYQDPEFRDVLKDEVMQGFAESLMAKMKTMPHVFANVDRPHDNNIKCNYVPNSLALDISFMTGLNYYNAIFIQRILDVDSRSRQVVLFMKEWVEENGIRQAMSAYVMTLLVISFLQSLNILPAGKDCQAGSVKVGKWECGMKPSFSIQKTNEKTTVPELVSGFFKYYSTFDYPNKVVCIYAGKVLNRSDVLSRQGWGIQSSMDAIDASTYDTKYNLFVMGPFGYDNTCTRKIGNDKKTFSTFKDLIYKSAKLTQQW